jgi:hypothetical protein
MANGKQQKESREVKPRYAVDKYGLMVNLAMSEKDELVVRQLLASINRRNQNPNNNWPQHPNGMPWCESC